MSRTEAGMSDGGGMFQLWLWVALLCPRPQLHRGSTGVWQPWHQLLVPILHQSSTSHERWEPRSLNQSAPPFLAWRSFPIPWGHGEMRQCVFTRGWEASTARNVRPCRHGKWAEEPTIFQTPTHGCKIRTVRYWSMALVISRLLEAARSEWHL